MGANTKIEWADHTFNPWIGCTKISAGCDHCYAEKRARRFGEGELWQGERRRTSPANWALPLKWNRAAYEAGEKQRVFCASMADVFDNQVPKLWRDDLWRLIERTPYLDWLLLTKRPQNIEKMLPDVADGFRPWQRGWGNVWLGATIENNAALDRNAVALKAVPARVHFWSCEPLLEAFGLFQPSLLPHWIICGGESGPGAREMPVEAARELRDICRLADVPFFFKQWGDWLPASDDKTYDEAVQHAQHIYGKYTAIRHHSDGRTYARVGKTRAGRLLDGVEHNGMPEVL